MLIGLTYTQMGVNSFERRFVCARYLILISRIQRLDIRNQNDRGLTKIKLQIFSDSTKCTGQQVLISTILEKNTRANRNRTHS